MIITLVMDQYGAVNNGTTVTTMRFAEVLKKHGHTVRVVAAAPKDQKIDDPNFYGVESYHIPVFNDFIASQGMVFAKPDDLVLREAIKGADVVHLLLPFPIQRHARLVAKDMGVAVTGAFHMQPENITYSIYLGKSKIVNNALYSFFKNSFYKYINHVHCPSEVVKHDLIKHGYKNQIHAISNGVSPRFVHLDNVEKPAELKDKFVVLMIGRLSREKRQDLIIKAIGESKYNDKIQLVLCGKGPWKAHLESLSKKYLKNPVIFSFLPQDELLKVINYSDLYVHASDAESEAKKLPKFKLVESEATYLLWIDITRTGKKSDELQKDIRDKTGLYLSGGTQYRGNGYNFLRMNIAMPRVLVQDGLDRLNEYFKKYGK